MQIFLFTPALSRGRPGLHHMSTHASRGGVRAAEPANAVSASIHWVEPQILFSVVVFFFLRVPSLLSYCVSKPKKKKMLEQRLIAINNKRHQQHQNFGKRKLSLKSPSAMFVTANAASEHLKLAKKKKKKKMFPLQTAQRESSLVSLYAIT